MHRANTLTAIAAGAALLFASPLAGQGRGVGHGGVHGTPPAPSAAASRGSDMRGAKTNSPKMTSTTPVTADTKAATQLGRHPALSTRLQPLLPPGTTLPNAALGFKNQGQFVAALHVSKNLGIPFDQLKAKMVGQNESLGHAIHDLRPSLTTKSANLEAKAAEHQAKFDIQQAQKQEELAEKREPKDRS